MGGGTARQTVCNRARFVDVCQERRLEPRCQPAGLAKHRSQSNRPASGLKRRGSSTIRRVATRDGGHGPVDRRACGGLRHDGNPRKKRGFLRLGQPAAKRASVRVVPAGKRRSPLITRRGLFPDRRRKTTLMAGADAGRMGGGGRQVARSRDGMQRVAGSRQHQVPSCQNDCHRILLAKAHGPVRSKTGPTVGYVT